MGIYPENDIYGIRWFLSNKTGKHMLYEVAYDTIMTKEQLQKAKDAYMRFQENEIAYNGEIEYQILVNVWTTYDNPPNSSKTWYRWNTKSDKKPWDDEFDVLS